MDFATLYVDVLFGVIGLSYLVYARKQQHAVALISGLGLSIFPYFVSNIWLVLLIGVAFVIAPFMIEL